MARELIREGVGTTEAAERCGFGDYSSFYRQYKKRMGVSPSQTRNMALDRLGGEMI
jgi:AraC-like DNA-binding protein